ncbi:SCO family protein [Congregibacter sp.]|jgi:protein SCO1/2|uniref:SCO family protein n=1 Tax=Congregibacter sp. TaxID=2744308 RepID=UPI0039E587BD
MNLIKKALVAFILLAALGSSALALINFGKPAKPPLIHGVVLLAPQPIAEFSLQDHRGQSFTNTRLAGQWHIVSYGYTDCPDICPTTLQVLSQLEERLENEDQYADLEVLFYTIDPLRDTVEHLAQYVPYFSDRFVGLAPGAQYADCLPFERSLGIQAVITPMPPGKQNLKGYTVSHGMMMYLINPQGELQAIFKPETTTSDVQFFSVDQLYNDYVALRNYYG